VRLIVANSYMLRLLYFTFTNRVQPFANLRGGGEGVGTRASRPSRAPCIARSAGTVVKLEFHDADTDTAILARILADKSDTRDFLKLFAWQAERRADILATMLARMMSARMSVSASWNASFTPLRRAADLSVWVDSAVSEEDVEDGDVAVLGGVVARRVAERVARVGLGAERQQLVKAGHLVTQHGEVERRPAERRRRQVHVALHVEQVLQHPGVALSHTHTHTHTAWCHSPHECKSSDASA